MSCRLKDLAAKLRDAGAGGTKAHAVLRRAWQEQQRQQHAHEEAGQQPGGPVEWVKPSTGGSMPVVHLHASLQMTDSLWAKLCK